MKKNDKDIYGLTISSEQLSNEELLYILTIVSGRVKNNPRFQRIRNLSIEGLEFLAKNINFEIDLIIHDFDAVITVTEIEISHNIKYETLLRRGCPKFFLVRYFAKNRKTVEADRIRFNLNWKNHGRPTKLNDYDSNRVEKYWLANANNDSSIVDRLIKISDHYNHLSLTSIVVYLEENNYLAT